MLPRLAPQQDAVREVVQHVTIARIEHRATPTPKPTPTPPPKHVLVIAQPRPQGVSAPKETIHRMGAARPKPPHAHQSPTPAPAYTPAQGAGVGNNRDAGSLGNGGTGQGAGAQGNGVGGGGELCGAVDFQAIGKAEQNPQTGYYEYNSVSAIVHYADGTSEKVPLDWTWRYKSESDDPFANDNAPMYFQPPPAAQRASEPPVVQYIIKYSNSNGHTLLNDKCPNIPQPSVAPNAQPT